MDLRLFTLVNPDNELEIFAVGIDLGDEAITYRPHNQFGKHSSAESALRLFSRITELRLLWEDDWEDDPDEPLSPEPCGETRECSDRF